MSAAVEQWAENVRTHTEDRKAWMLSEAAWQRKQVMLSIGMQMIAAADSMWIYAAFNPDIRVLDMALESSDRLKAKAIEFVFKALEAK